MRGVSARGVSVSGVNVRGVSVRGMSVKGVSVRGMSVTTEATEEGGRRMQAKSQNPTQRFWEL